jgi:hypothetical protein
LYRARWNDVSRALTRGHVSAIDCFQPQRDPRHGVARRERVCACGVGKTSETMIPNDEADKAKVVTNFNQFGRIMSPEPGGHVPRQKSGP